MRCPPKKKSNLNSLSQRLKFRDSLRFEILEVRYALSHSPIFMEGPGFKEALLASGGFHDRAADHRYVGNPAALTLVGEIEPVGTSGQNNTPANAQFLPHFGTATGKDPSADITGVLRNLPTAIASVEDNGSILLANPTGLVASDSGRVLVNGRIGDSLHGSTGTAHGDYDHYRLAANAGQMITIDVDAALQGSTLDSVVGIYNSAGSLLASNDNEFDNSVYGTNVDSFLRFIVTSNGAYSVVVFGAGHGFQSDPFNSASGTGAGSEGAYQLTILLESPTIVSSIEDDGAIPIANVIGLTPGVDGIAFARGEIGDGLHGSNGTNTGDFDFYRIQAAAGQIISVDIDTPIQLGGLDSIAAIYDSAGNQLSFSDDDFKTFDSFFSILAPSSGAYFVVVGGYTPDYFLANPFDPNSGFGAGSEGAYSVKIGLSANEVDYYSFNLKAGDILGASSNGAAGRLELVGPNGTLLIGSSQNISYLYPKTSPLPHDGNAVLSYVIDTPGRYALGVSRGVGSYTVALRGFRPALEKQPVFSHQVLFLDFDGATLTPEDSIPYINPISTISPLSASFAGLGLTAADESAVIRSITARVVENLARNVSGVLGMGANGDFEITDRAGAFQIEVLNSRDHADPFGLYPNVSRVVIGGTLDEVGAPFSFAGLSASIDVGNFDTSETAIVLGDWLGFVNTALLAPTATKIGLIGDSVGNIVSHEAGHFFGNWHTDPFASRDNMMNSYSSGDDGPDHIFGSEDDPVFQFGPGIYASGEGFEGIEDTRNVIAFGLSTGTKSGTYFDFVTGTLYVTGNIDDGHKDELEVKAVGTNIKIYINDKLVLTRPAAGVNRVVLNGSSDKDELDASNYQGSVTLYGRGGNDELAGGSNNDLLFGGDGNDELSGNAGNDVLVGGDGDDELDGGIGSDVLIGGLGSDDLQGGGGGDLLIGTRTAYDNNASALLAVVAEWSSSRSYADRIANLRGVGTGTRANGNTFLKTSGPQATIFEDAASDKLTGGSGRDWFFAKLSGNKKDKINNLDSNEWVDLLS